MLLKHFHSLGKFSRRQINIFLIFPRKQDLTFHAKCPHWRQFAWNIKSCFLGKNKKNISKCHLLKYLSRERSVKTNKSSSCSFVCLFATCTALLTVDLSRCWLLLICIFVMASVLKQTTCTAVWFIFLEPWLNKGAQLLNVVCNKRSNHSVL